MFIFSLLIHLLYSVCTLSYEGIHAIIPTIFEMTSRNVCSHSESTNNYSVQAELSTSKGVLNNATADDESIQLEHNHACMVMMINKDKDDDTVESRAVGKQVGLEQG